MDGWGNPDHDRTLNDLETGGPRGVGEPPFLLVWTPWVVYMAG